MKEREGGTKQLFRPISYKEKVGEAATDYAQRYGLDPLTSEALGKFANMELRLRQIKYDFVGMSTQKVSYPGWNGEGKRVEVEFTRENYREFIHGVSSSAFNLHTQYLAKTEAGRNAAARIQVFVKDLVIPNTD
jgi:hypothetical protein